MLNDNGFLARIIATEHIASSGTSYIRILRRIIHISIDFFVSSSTYFGTPPDRDHSIVEYKAKQMF